jgi:CubicO group peptidase (beta-lactamase class C family)
MAALQLLNSMRMQPTDSIAEWLPPYWWNALNKQEQAAVEQIEFSDLLRHQSGFNCILWQIDPDNQLPTMFAQCKAAIVSGLMNSTFLGSQTQHSAPACYDDANYEIIRAYS